MTLGFAQLEIDEGSYCSPIVKFKSMTTVTLAAILWIALAGAVCAQTTQDSVAEAVTAPKFQERIWQLSEDSLLGFVEIPAGPFPMGSNPLIDPMAFENERWSETRRQGAVYLPQYYIARYETTVAQFSAFIAETGYRLVEIPDTASADHPISGVSWTDAFAYARWLEKQLQSSEQVPVEIRSLLSSGWRLTLPDEAQWEKAARGTDPRIFPWGNVVRRDRANFAASGTVSVGSIHCPECPYGLSDMSGNVWEWTRSPYQPYPFTTEDDVANLQDDALWVIRGGSYNDAENNVRAAVRGAADPGARRPFIGFRLAIVRE